MKKKAFSNEGGKMSLKTVVMMILCVLFIFYLVSLRHASWSKPYVLVEDPPFQKEEVAKQLKEATLPNPVVYVPVTKESTLSGIAQNLLCSMKASSPLAIRHTTLLGVDENIPSELLSLFTGVQVFNSDKYWKITTAELPHGKNITANRKRFFYLLKRTSLILKTLENSHSSVIWSDTHTFWLGDIVSYVDANLGNCDVLFSDGEYWPFAFVNRFILPTFDPTFFAVRNSHGGRKLMKVWLGKLLEDWRASRYPKEKLVLHEALFQLWREGNLYIQSVGSDGGARNAEAVNVCYLPRNHFPRYDHAKERKITGDKEVMLMQPSQHSLVERNLFLVQNMWFWNHTKRACAKPKHLNKF